MQTLQQLQQELAGKEAETLFIIGNGFDLYHGLESRYSNFRGWLLRNATPQNGYKEFVEGMERLFPLETSQDMLWSNFEKALGRYDVNMIDEEYRKANGRDSEHKMLLETQKLCSQIRENMADWAAGIPLGKVRKQLDLNTDSWYLTFNYTKVLEDIYTIPDTHICHIHGDVKHKNDVITGHDWEYHHPDNDTESDVIRADMHEAFNKLLKKPDNQMEKHSDFLKGLAGIKHIVVIGHSLQDVDKDYFVKISQSVSPNAQWHFCEHQPKDRFAIYKMRSCLGTSVEFEQKGERYFTLPESKGNTTVWSKMENVNPYILGVASLTIVPLFMTWILMKFLPLSCCSGERILFGVSLSWFEILSFFITFFGFLFALLNLIPLQKRK